MKDSHWKAASLIVTTALIMIVASWATAQSGSIGPDEAKVIVEASKQRYVLAIGHASAKEVDKYIIYDSWNLAESEEIWVLENPHKAKSKWIRMGFDSRSK
jgi:hypothetical protein